MISNHVLVFIRQKKIKCKQGTNCDSTEWLCIILKRLANLFVAKQYNSKDKKNGCFYQQLLMIFTP